MNENIPCRSAKSRRASFGRHLCVSVCVCVRLYSTICVSSVRKRSWCRVCVCVCFSPYRNLRCVSSVSSWYSRWLPPPKGHLSMCVWVCVSSPWSVTLTWNYMAVSLRVSVWIQCPSDNDRHSIFLSVNRQFSAVKHWPVELSVHLYLSYCCYWNYTFKSPPEGLMKNKSESSREWTVLNPCVE